MRPINGEIRPQFFRVNYWEPTNFGEIITGLKYFKMREDAKGFSLRLVKRMEKEYKGTRDMPVVEIVDKSDDVIMATGVGSYQVLRATGRTTRTTRY